MTDRAAAAAELHRVLVPGGRVAVGTWRGIDEHPQFDAIQWALARHLGFATGAMMRAPFSLSDPAEVRGLLEDAGFQDIAIDIVRRRAMFSSWSSFGQHVIGAGPVAAHFAEATRIEQAAVLEDIRNDTLGMKMPDGQLAAMMTAIIATGTA